jgi:predicted metalloendopeptidase
MLSIKTISDRFHGLATHLIDRKYSDCKFTKHIRDGLIDNTQKHIEDYVTYNAISKLPDNKVHELEQRMPSMSEEAVWIFFEANISDFKTFLSLQLIDYERDFFTRQGAWLPSVGT